MNKIANIVIASVPLGISSAYADSITMTCYPTDSASSYNVTYYPEHNYTEIIGSWVNARSRLYKVLGKHSKSHVIYLRTKAEGQTRTVYLAFGYSDSGKDVSSIRVVDKTINYDKSDKCYIVPGAKPSSPAQEAFSSSPKSEAQPSPDVEAAKKWVAETLAIAEAAKKAAEEAEAATEAVKKAQEKARQESEKQSSEEAERKEEADKQIEKEAERNKEWREKIDEAHTKGLEYAKKRESKWSLTETNNPMTDEKDYTVKSTQLKRARCCC